MRKAFLPILAAIVLIGIATEFRRSAAQQRSNDSAANAAASDSPQDGHFTVHEWGTFTTFSGSDGVYLDFRPLAQEHSDLPSYVLDRASFVDVPLITKNRLWGRVRMETPVTYFYSDRVRTVDVRVDFPQGLLTEFYPPVQSILPAVDQQNIFGKGEAIGDSSLDWGTVDIIPIDQLVTNVADSQSHEQIANDIVTGLLPHGANEQHYAEARATDSALVHVRGKTNQWAAETGHFEKFLFYRGVGKFQLPVKASFKQSSIVMANEGELPIRSAILIDVNGDKIRAAKQDIVAAGQSVTFESAQSITNEQLAELVKDALVAEGLYEKEALSMVKTWQNSWFTETGTRILYMVPAPTTDELLPLHITPRPNETLRVLVGRMEIMSPDAENKMIGAVAKSIQQRSQHLADQSTQKKKQPYAIPASIKAFGRMAEPALVRVGKISKDPDVRREAELLVQQFRQ